MGVRKLKEQFCCGQSEGQRLKKVVGMEGGIESGEEWGGGLEGMVGGGRRKGRWEEGREEGGVCGRALDWGEGGTKGERGGKQDGGEKEGGGVAEIPHPECCSGPLIICRN